MRDREYPASYTYARWYSPSPLKRAPVCLIGDGDGSEELRGAEVGVALGGLDRGVAEELLDVVEGHAVVDEDRGEAVAQVVDAELI